MYKKSYTIHVCNKLFILAFFLSLHGTILAQSEFEQKIASLGYDVTEVNDWSDSTDIILPMPHVAYVNVTGIKTFPTMAMMIRQISLQQMTTLLIRDCRYCFRQRFDILT